MGACNAARGHSERWNTQHSRERRAPSARLCSWRTGGSRAADEHVSGSARTSAHTVSRAAALRALGAGLFRPPGLFALQSRRPPPARPAPLFIAHARMRPLRHAGSTPHAETISLAAVTLPLATGPRCMRQPPNERRMLVSLPPSPPLDAALRSSMRPLPARDQRPTRAIATTRSRTGALRRGFPPQAVPPLGAPGDRHPTRKGTWRLNTLRTSSRRAALHVGR